MTEFTSDVGLTSPGFVANGSSKDIDSSDMVERWVLCPK